MIANLNMQCTQAITGHDPTLYEWYDGAREAQLPVRIMDEARTLVAKCRAGADVPELSAMAKRAQRPGSGPLGDDAWRTVGFTVWRFVAHFNRLGWSYCDVCGRDGARTCAGCRSIAYCADHQAADWPAHKAWCRAHRSR